VAYRCASGVAAVMLLASMWVVLASASLVAHGSLPGSVLTIMLWCLTGVLVVNTLGNVRGSHPVERWGGWHPDGTAGCPLRCPGRDVNHRPPGAPALERPIGAHLATAFGATVT
jgi:hypothetical protein